jgi:hypothetical protein
MVPSREHRRSLQDGSWQLAGQNNSNLEWPAFPCYFISVGPSPHVLVCIVEMQALSMHRRCSSLVADTLKLMLLLLLLLLVLANSAVFQPPQAPCQNLSNSYLLFGFCCL